MSIQAVAWALEQKLPARPKLVLVSLANHANHTDGYCWLKISTIGNEASCSDRAVFNFLGSLISNGFIRKAPRRGDDGKQRANDYWLLLDRPEAEWVKPAKPIVVSEEDQDDDEAQDVEAYPAQNAVCNEEEKPPANPDETPACAVGPSAPACSHIEAEPSKIKPEESRAGAFTPRGYRPPPPPPPQPVASVAGGNGQYRFVYDGTPAYEAWALVKAKENGVSHWHLTVSKVIDGESKRGWYFPTLFPHKTPDNNGSDPPDKSLATKEEIREFGKTG